MAQGKKSWSAKRKTQQASNWEKARKREQARKDRSNGNNVAPGTFNGHTIGGYSVSKHGVEGATGRAETTRPSSARRAVRKARKRRVVTPKEVAA